MKRRRWTRERIEQLAKRLGSKAELARRIPTGHDVVSRWVHGHRNPSRISESALDRVEAEITES